MQFVVHDQFAGTVEIVTAETPRQAAETAIGNGLSLVLPGRTLALVETEGTSPGRLRFLDEMSNDGWGPGCRFEGLVPQHHVLIEVIPIKDA